MIGWLDQIGLILRGYAGTPVTAEIPPDTPTARIHTHTV